ncbi:hypothetical protein ACUODJ_55360, partial [Escherichia sp. HC-CC]
LDAVPIEGFDAAILDAEFGVVMLMYLRHAIEAVPSLNNPQTFSEQKLDEALYHGAVLRVRPKAMTVAVIITSEPAPVPHRIGSRPAI